MDDDITSGMARLRVTADARSQCVMLEMHQDSVVYMIPLSHMNAADLGTRLLMASGLIAFTMGQFGTVEEETAGHA